MAFVQVATGNWFNADHVSHVFYAFNAGNWEVKTLLLTGTTITVASLGTEAAAQSYVANLVESVGTMTVD